MLCPTDLLCSSHETNQLLHLKLENCLVSRDPCGYGALVVCVPVAVAVAAGGECNCANTQGLLVSGCCLLRIRSIDLCPRDGSRVAYGERTSQRTSLLYDHHCKSSSLYIPTYLYIDIFICKRVPTVTSFMYSFPSVVLGVGYTRMYISIGYVESF